MAIRNLGSGRTLLREWQAEHRLTTHENRQRTLVADARGVIYRYPMVNWPRLVFCQALLAMPLLLRWWLPRWRKRRAATHQTTVATP